MPINLKGRDSVWNVVHKGHDLLIEHGLCGNAADQRRERQGEALFLAKDMVQRGAEGADGYGRDQPGSLVYIVGQCHYRPADIQEAKVPEHRAVDRGLRDLAEKQPPNQHQRRADLPIGNIAVQSPPERGDVIFPAPCRRLRPLDEVQQRHADQKRRRGCERTAGNDLQPLGRQTGRVAEHDEPEYGHGSHALYRVSEVPLPRQNQYPPLSRNMLSRRPG